MGREGAPDAERNVDHDMAGDSRRSRSGADRARARGRPRPTLGAGRPAGRFPAVRLLAFTTLGFMALLAAYTLGLGGQVGVIIALTIIFVGALLEAWQPLIDWLTEP